MSDSEDEVDEAEELRLQNLAANRSGKRVSVLAERTDLNQDWTPPKHPKSPQQAAQIKVALARSFMFQSLPQSKIQEVIDAFKGPVQVYPGDQVIRQGDMVDSGEPGLYVLESGSLEAYVRRSADGDSLGQRQFTYNEMGQSFGELALLYNCPRAATIVAVTNAVLWSLDRETFNHCVKAGYQEVRRRHESFVESVEILSTLNCDERQKIVDVIQSQSFNSGENIIKRGDEGDRFYMVETGKARASVCGEVLEEYNPGDYFGELALLNSQQRVADVNAVVTPTVCLWMDSGTFRRLLGPLSTLMAERAKNYKPIGNGTDNAARSEEADGSRSLLSSLLNGWCSCTTMVKANSQ